MIFPWIRFKDGMRNSDFQSRTLTRLDILVRVFFLAGVLFLAGLPFLAGLTGDLFLSCRFKNLTGLSCPTCGMTRSFQSLVRLEWIHAFRYHLLGPVIYLSVVAMGIKVSLELILRKPVRPSLQEPWVRIFLMILFGTWMGFWVVRLLFELLGAGWE